MPSFRRKGPDEDDFGDYIDLDFKKKETYLFFYHVIAALAIGWPGEWLRRWASKHAKWIEQEYNVQIFRKRLDEF